MWLPTSNHKHSIVKNYNYNKYKKQIYLNKVIFADSISAFG